MKENCLLEAEIPGWLGHRLEDVRTLFPDLTDGQFFCHVIELGCLSMIDLYEQRSVQ